MVQITYDEGYSIASDMINEYCKVRKLVQLQEELKNKNININFNTLSAIKNKTLQHTYPGTIQKLLKYFGVKTIKKTTVTYFMVDEHQLNEIKNSCNGSKRRKK